MQEESMEYIDLVQGDKVDQRPFGCTFNGCDKHFARKSDLVRHERIHTNERPWACSWPGCKRDFIQRSALVVHMRTHTGERPHKCEYQGCEKAFSDSSSLARHRRIHTGKRPYMCAVRNCLKTFCRKTTLTKHIKKNHPQYAHSPDAVSLASFGPDTPQLGYTPSIGGDSAPQTPSDADQSDDDMANGSYSYFPPQLGQTPLPSYPSSTTRNSKQRSSRTRQTEYLSHDSPYDGYPDSSYSQAPSMERSVSHSSQAYLTPPTTHESRQRSSPRKAAARKGRYREYNSDDEDAEEDDYDPGAGAGGGGGDDDDDYVEGAEPVISGSGPKFRRGAVSVGSSRVSRQLRYPGNNHNHSSSSSSAQQQSYGQPPQHRSHRYQSQHHGGYDTSQQFAPPPHRSSHPSSSYQHQGGYSYHRSPEQKPQIEQYSPEMHSFSSFPMNASYTAPIPQYEGFEPHSHHQHGDSPSMGFAAPPLRRASSFSTLENAAGHFSSTSAGPMQNFAHHHLESSTEGSGSGSGGGGGGIGLGVSLGSPFPTPELHERRLSEMHDQSLAASSQQPTYSYDVFQDFAQPPPPHPHPHHTTTGPLSSSASDPLPVPSPVTTPNFAFARPLSTGNTPRRGSIGFPALPSHLTNKQQQGGYHQHQHQRAMYDNYDQSWNHPQQQQQRGFSNLTSRLLDRSIEDDGPPPQHDSVYHDESNLISY